MYSLSQLLLNGFLRASVGYLRNLYIAAKLLVPSGRISRGFFIGEIV